MTLDHCAVCGSAEHAHLHDQLGLILCANQACVAQAFEDAHYTYLERVRPRR